MKIYTKKGDKGSTRIIGKKIVTKDDARVEAYGTVDELNSWVGYTISLLTANTAELHDELEEIQQQLFDAGTDLATLNDDPKRDFIFNQKQPRGWRARSISTPKPSQPSKNSSCQVVRNQHPHCTLQERSPVGRTLHRDITRRRRHQPRCIGLHEPLIRLLLRSSALCKHVGEA